MGKWVWGDGGKGSGQIVSSHCCLRQKEGRPVQLLSFLLGLQVKLFALHRFLVMLTTSMVERAWNVGTFCSSALEEEPLPCACVLASSLS